MILIVDDKPENIFALKTILKLNNFAVDSANSGEESLKKIMKNNYSLIILDVQMSEMDGFEMAKMIVSCGKSKDTPIIFLTAILKEKKFITRGYKAGAIDYIIKPVDPDILLLKVSSFYAMSEQRLELKKIQEKLLKEIDIRKNSQKELLYKNQELNSVMESIPQIAFTINRDGKIEYANKKWIEFFGPELRLPELYPAEIFIHLHEALLKGKEFEEEVKIKQLSDSSSRYYLLKIIPLSQDKITTKWVGTFTDIHQQKLANEVLEQKVKERTFELTEKNKQLEIFNQELQQVAWVLSHDLKEPVRKILTYGNLMKDKYLKDNADALTYLHRILRSSHRMSNLIDDLLDFSKVLSSDDFQETNLNQVINDVLVDIEDKIEQLDAKIKVDTFPLIQTLPNQMRQLFQNLISNALKFSKPGEQPVIKITSELVESLNFDSKVSSTGTFCRVKVIDNGMGFEEKYLDRIFKVFQRLVHKEIEGTGIGLAIVKKIIEKHHGIITATSNIDEGATFIIMLPLSQKTK